MSQGITTVVYSVTDLAQSKEIFKVWLGAEPTTDSEWYVGFSINGQEIGLTPSNPDSNGTGPVNYVTVEDIAVSLEALVGAGATVHAEARDVGGGNLIASVVDASGNVIGLSQTA